MTTDSPARPATWLEVALNGPWSPKQQPLAPVAAEAIIEEGVACAEAGAAILHVHARDPETGRQRDDADLYAPIIEGIRARCDAIVYPTFALAGASGDPSDPADGSGDGRQRFAAVDALARRGLCEWMGVDPGSVNFALDRQVAEDRPGFVYLNPETHVRAGLAVAAEHGLHPGYAIYEPGFLRLGAALAARLPAAPQAIYRFMFSDGFLFGFPPAPYALDAYLALLADAAPAAPWMVAGLTVDVGPLIGQTVERGGHVRVGLEDAPLGSDLSNLDWTRRATRAIEAAGGRVAAPADVRTALKGEGVGDA